MTLHLQPVRVATSSEDSDGQLVFADGFLVAVLVRLSDQHGADVGLWFLEAAFGLTSVMSAPLFLDLDAAQGWIERHLGAKRSNQ
ncbi:hypothetical protein [Methylobacterium pseudosasicola]|uniref:Uncharacterized protein n=1 Tax=Methylobacterium pseudosasicola TaxID=582667 RepID=A0A1I4RYX4_9HYPH|nr:hypothetical protein [Methylobacterium pseudosasicola]SFM57204.1 hypothetical protein SAMN05192568_103863 [Methylobacterium pseudosasicola]